MTHKEEPDYTYWERDEDGYWRRHDDKYLTIEKKGIRAVLSPTIAGFLSYFCSFFHKL
jgi:hypothetical protein